MADKKLTVEVVTPERSVAGKEIDSLVVPASEGYLGVLPGHAPLVTGLQVGVITMKNGGQDETIAISGGFMEVIEDKVTIMPDTAETAAEIDAARAERAKERAEERLEKRPEGLDAARAEAALQRAIARIKAVKGVR
ncbi:F0F1 ATP synthase subunit epsilon [Metallumcola ferriviriculae]|uniref:ATP synthase epsilon chain n=1 Tax=Metallumcola ferriviriculae TaxID=3039180 RepID=A0AAU0UKC4_9FIRM|nr:F0F1 ATP synthase subunit epsilon [Desulfitibacteraceae bacterium MK1]